MRSSDNFQLKELKNDFNKIKREVEVLEVAANCGILSDPSLGNKIKEHCRGSNLFFTLNQ